MTSKIGRTVLALTAATLIASSLSFAKSHQVNLIYTVKVGTKAQLNPGRYQIHVVQAANSTKLVFYNRRHERVAQVPVKIKPEGRKNPYTEIDYNTVAKNERAITAIRLGGWTEEFLISSPSAGMASKPMGLSGAKSSS